MVSAQLHVARVSPLAKTSAPRARSGFPYLPRMRADNLDRDDWVDESRRWEAGVKLPRIKTLNHQIDVIEVNSTATEARLANVEKLLQRIAEQLEKKPG